MPSSTRKTPAAAAARPAPTPGGPPLPGGLDLPPVLLDEPVRVRPPWLDDLLLPWLVCAQRILVVADGSLDFNETNQFGLTRFLNELEQAEPFGLKPVIHLAHRTNNTNLASAAVKARFPFFPGFTFASGAAAPALMNGAARRYDQVWLFGITDNAIGDAEVRVIASFMAARGGVFATGDHSTLGRGMSGRLPRVRKMREWAAVPMGGMERIDTVNEPSPDGTWQFNSQSDELAQRIFPHFEQGADGVFRPHPLLRLPSGENFQTDVMDRLPDHPHESRCLAGFALDAPYDLVSGIPAQEFPPLPAATAPFAPQVVATSVSGGRIIEKGPVTPQCFGAMSAYDGHRVGLGRIVCDATWHHFVNINLDGTGSARKGLRTSITLPFPPVTLHLPNAAYRKIAQYYRNIALWLGAVRRCWPVRVLVVERFRDPLIEELPTLLPDPRVPLDWPRRVALGEAVRGSIDERFGAGTAAQMVLEQLEGAQSGLLEAQRPGGKGAVPHLVPGGQALDGLLGGLAADVFRQLPDDPWEAAVRLKKQRDADAASEKLVVESLREGVQLARRHYSDAAKHTIELLGKLG